MNNNIINSKELPLKSKKSGWPWEMSNEYINDIKNNSNIIPKISIITPSYNQGKYIEETIRSVLLQGYPNLEYIIIDGGSTDNSVEIIKKYQKWVKYWVSEKDEGQSHAINKGAKYATGELMGWLNSDDKYFENTFNVIADLYRTFPNHVAYAGVCEKKYIDTNKENELIHPRNLTQNSLCNWGKDGFLYQPACLFKRSTFMEVGMLNQGLHNAMDQELWVKLAGVGEFAVTDEIIAQALIHKDMKTLKYIDRRDVESISIAVKYGNTDAAIDRLLLNRHNYINTRIKNKELIKIVYKKLKKYLLYI